MSFFGRTFLRVLRAVWKVLAAIVAVLHLTGRRRRDRIVERGEPAPRAELAVIALLVGVACFAVMFIVIYAANWPNDTQYFGLAIGGAFALLSAALIIASKSLVVDEEIEEEYHDPGTPEEQEKIIQIVDESGTRITRKRFLKGAAGAAGAALGAALVVPAASMGPVIDTRQLYYSPWHPGRRLVDEAGRPYKADDISHETFYTAYPQNISHEVLAAPLVVVRIRPENLNLPQGRRDWAPEGILAFSKICPHAGCAVSEYRKPLFEPTSPQPALVCPCHYSTFNPANGGSVIFGPAGRSLPQLPLMIDGDRELRAAGDLDSPVGPSFWGIRSD